MNLWDRIVNLVTRQRPVQERTFVPYSQGGVTVTQDTALQFGAVWACVNVIARTIAARPWLVYEKTGAGRKQLDNTVSWLLNNQPNPEMTAVVFRETMMGHVLTWGNAYAEIVFDMAGRPTALWPLSPDRVDIIRDERTGNLVYRVWSDTDHRLFAPSDILHIHGLGFDGVYGYSPVRMMARSLGVGMAQDVFAQAFYANGTVFGAVAEMPGNLNPEQIKETEAHLNSTRKGPDNAFRLKVVPKDTKLHQTSMPLTDAQFLESRKFSVTEICRWYGVPPHKVADLERSTNNNIEHQGIEFVTDAIVPWAVRLEQEANVKLFGQRAQGRVYTKLDLVDLMRGDATARGNFYRTMTQIGAMSINEVREAEDYDGIGPAGDQHLVQLNQTTLEYLVANPDAKAQGAAPKEEPASPPAQAPAPPTNVIRAQALEWLREQRKQA